MADKAKTMGTMKILILHGWSYSTDKWAPFMKLLEEAGLRPQLLEIPGLTAPIKEPWTLDDYVEWLKEKVGQEKVILIGHSNGGRISLAFSLKYPESVERLILIDSAGIFHKEMPIRIKRFIFKNLARAGKKITKSSQAREALYRAARVKDYKEADPHMRETMINLTSVDLRDRLHEVTAPALIIWGAKDKTTPLRDGRTMHKLIPKSRLHVVEGAYHSPQFTHPEEVCARIIKELNGGI